MKKEKITEALRTLFVPRDTPLEGVCFRSEYMKEASPFYGVYNAVSDAQRDSGLSFGFSYRIADIAVSLLADGGDWDDDDAMHELVDQSVPVYTSELMEIYQGDAWAVDEAVKELGTPDAESDKRAALGWYMQIESMVSAIKNNLEPLIDGNDGQGE